MKKILSLIVLLSSYSLNAQIRRMQTVKPALIKADTSKTKASQINVNKSKVMVARKTAVELMPVFDITKVKLQSNKYKASKQRASESIQRFVNFDQAANILGKSVLGDPAGPVQIFAKASLKPYTNGALIYSAMGTYFLKGAILQYWKDNGNGSGSIGLPISDVVMIDNNGMYAEFVVGEIDVHRENVTRVYYRPNTGCFEFSPNIVSYRFDKVGHPLKAYSNTAFGKIWECTDGIVCYNETFGILNSFKECKGEELSNDLIYGRSYQFGVNAALELQSIKITNGIAEVVIKTPLRSDIGCYWIAGIRPVNAIQDVQSWDQYKGNTFKFPVAQSKTIYRMYLAAYRPADIILDGRIISELEFFFITP